MRGPRVSTRTGKLELAMSLPPSSIIMNKSVPQYRLFAPWAEVPLALTCLGLAVITLIWKTVGLESVPGWEEMFGNRLPTSP